MPLGALISIFSPIPNSEHAKHTMNNKKYNLFIYISHEFNTWSGLLCQIRNLKPNLIQIS